MVVGVELLLPESSDRLRPQLIPAPQDGGDVSRVIHAR
jgi:hypothetical protein